MDTHTWVLMPLEALCPLDLIEGARHAHVIVHRDALGHLRVAGYRVNERTGAAEIKAFPEAVQLDVLVSEISD